MHPKFTVRRSPFRGPQSSSVGKGKPRLRSLEELEGLEFDALSEATETAIRERKQHALDDLMAEVTSKLSEIVADEKFEKIRSRDALKWLVKNPHSLLTFLRSGAWHVTQGNFRRSRDGMTVRHPHLPAASAHLNGILFATAIKQVFETLSQPSTIEMDDEDQRLTLRAIGIGLIEKLEENYLSDNENPVFAFQARLVARSLGMPTPLWVETYLDRASKNVDDMVGHQSDRTRTDVGIIFEFVKRDQDSAAALGRAYKIDRDNKIFAIMHRNRIDGKPWPKAVMDEVRDKVEIRLEDPMIKTIYNSKLAELGLPPVLAKLGRPRKDRDNVPKPPEGKRGMPRRER